MLQAGDGVIRDEATISGNEIPIAEANPALLLEPTQRLPVEAGKHLAVLAQAKEPSYNSEPID